MPSLPELLAMLKDSIEAVRAEAAEIFADSLEDARAAAVPLCEAASDSCGAVRDWATSALEDLGTPSSEDVPALEKRLFDSPADTAYWAATLLGRLRKESEVATKRLQEALNVRKEPHVKERIQRALAQGPA